MNKKSEDAIARVTISMPEKLLKTIDFGANENNLNRSRWFLQAALMKIDCDAENKIDKVVRG